MNLDQHSNKIKFEPLKISKKNEILGSLIHNCFYIKHESIFTKKNDAVTIASKSKLMNENQLLYMLKVTHQPNIWSR